jgi:hypothetical protein
MRIDYEPRFIEEAVLRAIASRPEARRFYRERDAAYDVPDPEARGRAFDALHGAWYERLGLGAPLAQALGEQPLIAAGVARCAVGRSPRRQDAGAELLVRAEPGERVDARLLRLLLAPEALLERGPLLCFLRRELQHVADMLDPAFGYTPALPPAGGPAHERLLRDRYRAAWNATVDGRLVRAHRLPGSARGERLLEFASAFPSLGEAIEDVFALVFEDPAPTHATLVALVSTAGGAPAGVGACALCGFPGADRDPALAALPAQVVAAIRCDFPDWTAEAGCCRQCADLYRAQKLSAAGAAALPGIR